MNRFKKRSKISEKLMRHFYRKARDSMTVTERKRFHIMLLKYIYKAALKNMNFAELTEFKSEVVKDAKETEIRLKYERRMVNSGKPTEKALCSSRKAAVIIEDDFFDNYTEGV